MARKSATGTTEPPAKNKEAEGDLNSALSPTSPALPAMQVGEVSGEVSASDLVIPRLKVAYGVGALATDFNPGDLVLNDEFRLAGKGEPIKTTALSVSKYWKERKAYDPNDTELPKTFASEKEIHAMGLSTQWRDDPDRPGKRLPPDYQEAATLMLLLEKPQDLDCVMFSLEFEGRFFTPVLFYVDKAAYSRSAKRVLSARQMQLSSRGLFSGEFITYTEMEMLGGNPTVIPHLKLVGINPQEFVDWVKFTFNVTEPSAG